MSHDAHREWGKEMNGQTSATASEKELQVSHTASVSKSNNMQSIHSRIKLVGEMVTNWAQT